jgi:hypothetical protein
MVAPALSKTQTLASARWGQNGRKKGQSARKELEGAAGATGEDGTI